LSLSGRRVGEPGELALALKDVPWQQLTPRHTQSKELAWESQEESETMSSVSMLV